MAKKAKTIEQVNRLLKTPRAMITWLEAMSPRATAAQDISEPRECLLANFLTAKGFDGVVCGPWHFSINESYLEMQHPNPEWFNRVFVSLCDLSRRRVTAAQALRALKTVV